MAQVRAKKRPVPSRVCAWERSACCDYGTKEFVDVICCVVEECSATELASSVEWATEGVESHAARPTVSLVR